MEKNPTISNRTVMVYECVSDEKYSHLRLFTILSLQKGGVKWKNGGQLILKALNITDMNTI